jgi:glycosyltransferase involved in cell wall biosynthesis
VSSSLVTALIITRGDLPELMAEREAQYERLGIPLLIIESKDVLTRWTSAERFVDTPYVFFQDDDVALPDEQITAIIADAKADRIVASMYDEWIQGMGYWDLALVGLGAVAPVGLWREAIARWTAAYPDAHEHLAWDADFIIGILTRWERKDYGGEATILPEASADNRLWKQPGQLERKVESMNMARALKTVTGAVMVKDGAETIKAAMESVAPMVDSFTLFDTGSTDDTVPIALATAEALGKDIHIKHGIFEGFAVSRNVLIEEARKNADYFLMFDADEVWVGDKTLPPLAMDVFMVNYSGPIRYGHPRIIRSNFDCWFEGRVHAAMTWDIPANGATLDGLTIEHHGDLTHGDQEARIRKDIALLKEDLEAGVDPQHTHFMLGKSYDGVADWANARLHYEKRLEYDDEGSEQQYYSAWRLGCILIEKFGEFHQGADLLYSAWMNRPTRIESIRYLARYLNQVADATPIPDTDLVFVHRDEYNTTSQQEG